MKRALVIGGSIALIAMVAFVRADVSRVFAEVQIGPATPPTSQPPTLPNPLDTTGTGCNFLCVLDRVLDLLRTIAIPITAIMVVFGGLQMLFAAGNPEKITKAQKTILYAAIGFAIVLLASSVVPLIQNILGA